MPLLPAYSNLARTVRHLRRSESAPVLTADIDLYDVGSDDDVQPSRDPHSMGYPSSPTGYMAYGSLHWSLMSSVVRVAPTLEVGQWSDNGCVYCIIWFHPTQQRGMLRPDQWHATLSMLRPTRDLSFDDRQLLSYATQRVRDMWESVLRNIIVDSTSLQLSHPPPEWTRSWNFGISGEWTVAADIMTSTAEHVLGELEFLHLRTRRPLHISWH